MNSVPPITPSWFVFLDLIHVRPTFKIHFAPSTRRFASMSTFTAVISYRSGIFGVLTFTQELIRYYFSYRRSFRCSRLELLRLVESIPTVRGQQRREQREENRIKFVRLGVVTSLSIYTRIVNELAPSGPKALSNRFTRKSSLAAICCCYDSLHAHEA